MTIPLKKLRRKSLGRETRVEFTVWKVDVPGRCVVTLVVIGVVVRLEVRRQS